MAEEAQNTDFCVLWELGIVSNFAADFERSPKGAKRFGIRDSGFKIRDSGFKIQDSRFRIQDSGFKIRDSRFRIQDSGFKKFKKFKSLR